MSAGLRRYRARIYAYTDSGASGAVTSTYTPVLSGDPDGNWWCSRGVPSGRERTLVGAAEHSIDAVFGFARDVLLTDNGLLVSDGVQYLVRSIQPRMVGLDEIAVYVERTADAFTFIDDPGETLPTPEIAVTSSISATAVEGTSPPPLAVPITNSTGTLALLGVVTASLVTPVSWASVVYAAGVATLTYTTDAEPASTLNNILRITATLAGTSPVDVPITVTITAVVVPPVPGTYPPGPSLATVTNGYVWNNSLGYPEGSIFNALASYRELDDGAMPAFGGTERFVTTQGTADADFAAAWAASADGDIITVTAGLVLTDRQLPVRSGWVYGVGGMVQVRTGLHASLVTRTACSTPAQCGDALCVDHVADAPLMVRFQTATTNRSCLNFQQSSGGVWFTGIELHYSGTYYGGTSQVLDLGAKSGTNPGVQTTDAHCPGQIVFDRCIVTTAVGANHPSLGLPPGFGLDCVNAGMAVRMNGRGVAFYQCDLGFTFNQFLAENKSFVVGNTPGPFAVLGTKFAGWGIPLLGGGLGNPTITDVSPADCVSMWNRIWNDPGALTSRADDECKNGFEVKAGVRWMNLFNDYDYFAFRDDQRYLFVIKSNSQSSGPAATRVEDPIVWGNRARHCCKGILQLTDVNSGAGGPGGALGVVRPEVRYNLVPFDSSFAASRFNAGSAFQQRAMTISGSQGDGIPTLVVDHNTFGGKSSFWYGSFSPGELAWLSVQVTNNVLMDVPTYGCVFGVGPGTGAYPALSETPALTREYGAGHYTVRNNFVPLGARNWDAALRADGNGQMASASKMVNFVDAAGGDYTLTVASGIQGAATDGTDPGYDEAYVAAMIPVW